MYLKPTKSYGKEYRCKIYKHFVEPKVKALEKTSDITYFCIYDKKKNVVIGQVDFSVASEDNISWQGTDSSKTDVLFGEKTLIELKVNECALVKDNNGNNVIVRVKSVPDTIIDQYSLPLCEVVKVGDFKGTLKYETNKSDFTLESIVKQYELNKYYYFSDLAYMPIDDIQDSQEQYLKGNIVKTQTRVIRYDVESKLDLHDIVVIDNVAYIVEDIFTHTKVGLNMYKTYNATLMKLGV